MKMHIKSTTMFLVLCLAIAIVGTLADEFSQIIESSKSDDGQGNYEFQFRTSDGITRWQTGRLQYDGDKPYIHVEGGYSYIDRQNQVKRITTFVADHNGYRPTYSQEILPPERPQEYPSRFGAGASGG